MPLYVVERELPGIPPPATLQRRRPRQILLRRNLGSAQAAQARLERARNSPIRPGRSESVVRGSSKEGRSVHWIRSFFLPATAQTHCYFEAASPEVVAEANQRANIPFLRIAEVVEMTPEAL